MWIQEETEVSKEMEDRNTHILYEKDKIGEVQIADEVVAIIAGLAATEVRRGFHGRQYYQRTGG